LAILASLSPFPQRPHPHVPSLHLTISLISDSPLPSRSSHFITSLTLYRRLAAAQSLSGHASRPQWDTTQASRPQASQRRFKTPSRLSRPPAALPRTLQDLAYTHYPLFTSQDSSFTQSLLEQDGSDLALALPHSLSPSSRPPLSQSTLNFAHSSPRTVLTFPSLLTSTISQTSLL
jgi:hypothetical protein